MDRSRGPLATLLLVVSVLLSGCGDHPPRDVVTRDSSGIRIIEHPPLRAGEPLTLLEDSLPLGGLPGDAGLDGPEGAGALPTFSRISAIDEGPAGLVYVLDGVEGAVTVLDPEAGEVIRQFGRRGQGPGEFRSAADLQVSEDGSVLVGERIPLRIHRFTGEGIYEGSARLDLEAAPRDDAVRAGRAAALAEWRALPDGDLVARILTLDRDPTRSGMNRLVRVSPEGVLRSAILRWREPGSLADPPPLLSAKRSWTTGGEGQVHYADGEAFEVRTLDPAGRLRRILRRAVPSRPVTREQRDLALQAFRESMIEGGAPVGMVEAVTGDLEVARHLPSVHGLWSDHDRGELWVGIPDVSGRRGDLAVREYHLFDAGGRFIGRVVPPPGFRLHSVRSRRMLGSVVDELGVPHPRVYRISPPPGS